MMHNNKFLKKISRLPKYIFQSTACEDKSLYWHDDVYHNKRNMFLLGQQDMIENKPRRKISNNDYNHGYNSTWQLVNRHIIDKTAKVERYYQNTLLTYDLYRTLLFGFHYFIANIYCFFLILRYHGYYDKLTNELESFKFHSLSIFCEPNGKEVKFFNIDAGQSQIFPVSF